jgi:hypothetical protein
VSKEKRKKFFLLFPLCSLFAHCCQPTAIQQLATHSCERKIVIEDEREAKETIVRVNASRVSGEKTIEPAPHKLFLNLSMRVLLISSSVPPCTKKKVLCVFSSQAFSLFGNAKQDEGLHSRALSYARILVQGKFIVRNLSYEIYEQ